MLTQSAAYSEELQIRQRRIFAVLLVGAALTLLILARAACLAGRRTRANIPHEEFLIPGLRGSIIGQDGQILACSERKLRLVWKVPENEQEAAQERELLAAQEKLRQYLPPAEKLTQCRGEKIFVLEDFSGALEQELLALVDSGHLFFEGYFVRNRYAVAAVIGKVEVDPDSGLEIGKTGLEKKYDSRLRGKTIRYTRVAADNKLIRIHNSLFSESGNGEDVVVDYP